MDKLPSNINIYQNNNKCDIKSHVIYKESVRISKDKIVNETLTNNLNSKDINVVISDEIMSLLMNINENNKWKSNFMIPFIIKSNLNNNILFMDKPCLKQNIGSEDIVIINIINMYFDHI